jgi:hypothetical protein
LLAIHLNFEGLDGMRDDSGVHEFWMTLYNTTYPAKKNMMGPRADRYKVVRFDFGDEAGQLA